MTGVKFEQLFGINSAEELITAELYGKSTIPSDDPDNLYLFSVGHGLTARYNERFFASISKETEGFVPNQTIQELHNIYQNHTRPSTPDDLAFVEFNLDSIASEFVSCWNDLMSGPQTLEHRQQGYHCNNQNQYCFHSGDCKSF